MNDKSTILAVDDSPESMALLAKILTPEGYHVRPVDSGELALGAVATDPPDLILLEVRMKGMDGLEVCRRLKARKETWHIPIILMSGFADGKGWVEGLRLGAADHITKPFQSEEFLTRVKTHLTPKLANVLYEQQAVLRRTNEQLQSEIVERQRMEHKLLRSRDKIERSRQELISALDELERAEANLARENAVKEAVNRILRGALQANSDVEVAHICLSEAEALTGSKFGWIGEVNPPGRLDTIALSDSGEARWIRSQMATFKAMKIGGIFGRVLKNGKSLITNEPSVYPDEVVVPSGHPKLTAFLGVPLKQDGRTVGMIALGNKPSGFTPHDQEAVEALSVGLEAALQRKRAEADRELLVTAIEQTGEVVIITDPEGTIQYVNPAFERVTGYLRTEAFGQNLDILKSGKQGEAFYRELWATIKNRKMWQGRIVNKRKEGELFTGEATISPVCDDSGLVVNYVAVMRDITDKLKMAAQFIQSQKLEAVGRMTGGIAHDFNNLLTTIIGNADLAIGEMGKESSLYEFLEDIKGAGERAAWLIRELMVFSRKQILQTEVVNLNETVGNMDRLLRRVIREDIELETILSPDLGRVEADVGQIEQIFMNLAVNASDAMPGGGKLTLETSNVELNETYVRDHTGVISGPHVMLAVSDTGIGMTEEVQNRLFEPFFTTKEKGQGTGLGLSTVYGIVKQSSGNILVYSELGKGSTFKIYLPRVEKTVPNMERPGKKAESLQGSETILMVEDDDMVRNFALKALKKYGYTVLCAGDGQEALHILREHKEPFQLMVTDAVMPRMSGKELVKRLEGQRPELKVLFMSGYTEDAIVLQGMLDKGIAFIQKPFTSGALGRKVREVLDK